MRTAILILLLAVDRGPHVARFDKLEVNTFGRAGAVQIIAWDWSRLEKCWHVEWWCLRKHAVNLHRNRHGWWEFTHTETGATVTAPALKRSRTLCDPEQVDRNVYSSARRRGLFGN